MTLLDTTWQDTRFACRLIGKNPWASVTIIVTLTLGIALNVSVFSLLNGFLLRPWVRVEPGTFISLIPRYAGDYQLRFSSYGSMSQPDFERYGSAASIDSLGAYRLTETTVSGDEAGTLRAALVSCNLPGVIGQPPVLRGRHLTADDCSSSAAVAVLSEAAWRARFNGDTTIVGRTIRLNREPLTVVGVAASLTLPGPAQDTDVWVPYALFGRLRPSADYAFTDPRAQWLTVVGRRKPGYTLAQVEQELQTLAQTGDRTVPGRRTSLIVTDGSLARDPETRQRVPIIFGITLGATTVLLLLACVNVATLLLCRAAARQREISIRISMGASRIRLLRQLLTEGLVLSGVSGVIGFLIARRGPWLLWSSVVDYDPPFDLTPDWRVIVYCVGVATMTGIVAGLSPALESIRPQPAESLKGLSGAVTAGRRRARLRNGLVATQIALSLLLLVEVALFLRAQRGFFSYDPGFETRQVVSVTLASVLSDFRPAPAFYEQLEARMRGVPGVVSTSFASLAPWAGRNPTPLREIDGRRLVGPADFEQAPARRQVSPDYFATLGITLIRGRTLTTADRPAGAGVVPTVISEAMARRHWPNVDPVGHRFRVTAVHEVVGVVRDTQSLAYMQDDGPVYYEPLDGRTAPANLLVRVAGDPRAASPAAREIVRQLDPHMAVTAATLASSVEEQGARLQPLMIQAAIAAALAALLALSGVFGVVSFSVNQRTHELGIRMALGARPLQVIVLVMRSGATPIAGGLMVGIAMAAAVSMPITSVLPGVDARDPLTFSIVALGLLAASLAAVLVPARRAASLDPLRSLRQN